MIHGFFEDQDVLPVRRTTGLKLKEKGSVRDPRTT